jgi:hypothetical protein
MRIPVIMGLPPKKVRNKPVMKKFLSKISEIDKAEEEK